MGATLLPDLATEIFIPVCAVIGIAFALFQWLLVSKVKLSAARDASSGAAGKNGFNDYLIEEEEGINDHNVVQKCAEIQNAISEVNLDGKQNCSSTRVPHFIDSLLAELQTVHEGRIYQLKLFCDKDYPEKPPSVRFHSRINMTCVNHETGVVEPKKFGLLANWQREYTMEDILTQLKKEMAAPHNRKLVQPPEGTYF